MPVDNVVQNPANDAPDPMDELLKEVDREGVIRLLDFILDKQMRKQPLTAYEVHRHFLESTSGSKVAMALGGKKLLSRLEKMEILRLRKQVGATSIPCLEITEKGSHYLQKLRNFA